MCLFLCQYHTVLITMALKYNLKSGSMRSPALLFFLRIALAIQGFSWFHVNFRIVCSSSVGKCHWNFDRDCTDSIDCFRYYGHFKNISSSNPGAQNVFLFICVFFHFFHPCLIISFQCRGFSHPLLNLFLSILLFLMQL